jgi:ABC-type Fe3+-hydroxamate transport system substrate-binding protein
MPRAQMIDDLGFKVDLESSPGRIVSLVPSWTETLFALGLGERVVGVTKFCVEPVERVGSIRKVGGTKNPDLRAIAALAPDLIIANAEENRREDVERMRAQGFSILITYPRTVPAAVESLLKIGRVAGCEAEADAMARDITRTVSEVEADVGVWAKLRLRAFCPIWKKPWMAFNADTYAHDVLRMMGFNNVYAAVGERYPATTLKKAIELRPDVVLLPDEPYEFSDKDVDELRAVLPPGLARRVLIINGRDLHWYGVHMVSGLKSLAQRLAKVRAAVL